MWLIEAVLVVAIFVAGVRYCLSRCRIDPRAHFLIDFSCLYAPVALTTSIVIWAGFHLVVTLPIVLDVTALPWVSSAYAYDVVRLGFYVAAVLVIFWRVGEHMQRVSAARQRA